MQLLHNPSIQQTNSERQIFQMLEDVTNKVTIQSNFCIEHRDYKSFELPAEIVSRFLKMPQEIQTRYWSLQLRGFLYGIYYNGSLQKTLAINTDATQPLDLENNSFLGVDLSFFEQLHNSNQGTGYFDPSWSVIQQEEDGALVVTKGGLRLHIEPEIHLPASEKATVGETVAIRMPKNLMQNGFYMAVGNAGTKSELSFDYLPEVVRVYFNLTPEGAVAIMGSLTEKLNAVSLPFSFKVLYNPGDYGRYDSGVLYFEKPHYETVHAILEEVYLAHQAHFNPQVPLFTKQLAPGLGLAEEPNTKFGEQESFGMNRCQIVANGLLEARQNGDESPEARMTAILEHFSLLGIDVERPYLNATSEDIYTPLSLCYK